MLARAGGVAVGLVIVGLTVAAAGTPPESRCTERKERAAARKAAGLLDCQAKTEPSPPDPSCVAKVRQRFAEAWAKIELRGGCPTPGDVDAVESRTQPSSIGATLPLVSTSGRILSWEPPSRAVLSWEISAVCQHDPSRETEVEVRFIAEAKGGTRVEREHHHLDRHAARRDERRGIFDSEGGWNGLLASFARVAAA